MADRRFGTSEPSLWAVIERLGKPGRDLAVVIAVARCNNDGRRASIAEVRREIPQRVGFNHRTTVGNALESAECAGIVVNRASDGQSYDYVVRAEAAAWLVACLEAAATELRALELLDEPGGER